MVTNEVVIADKNEPLINLQDAIQIALLHDVLEDTSITKEELLQHFNPQVVHGVDLMTKRKNQPIHEYLQRIKDGPKDIALIKICDRITNLQKPPTAWKSEKIIGYLEESNVILEMLGGGHIYAVNRLKLKIESYQQYI
jgi:(p)ppGpp synthase/HD superfamily hydrolase